MHLGGWEGFLFGCGSAIFGAALFRVPAWRDARARRRLVQDEILGHDGSPGVLPKPSLTTRLDAQGRKLDDQTGRLDQLHDYSHRARHETLGTLKAIEVRDQGIDLRLQSIEANTGPNGELAGHIARVAAVQAESLPKLDKAIADVADLSTRVGRLEERRP